MKSTIYTLIPLLSNNCLINCFKTIHELTLILRISIFSRIWFKISFLNSMVKSFSFTFLSRCMWSCISPWFFLQHFKAYLKPHAHLILTIGKQIYRQRRKTIQYNSPKEPYRVFHYHSLLQHLTGTKYLGALRSLHHLCTKERKLRIFII